jgi:hypothetical protein
MNRSAGLSLGVALANLVAALTPLAAHAQAAAEADLTPDQVRAEFARAGYAADAPLSWWTSSRVTTFTVSDPAEQGSPNARVLMVLVYPDSATAQSERSRAIARDYEDALAASFSDQCPHLIPGYGPSVWRQNVAMVQSTRGELERRYATELDRGNGVSTSTAGPTPIPVTYAVDLEFLGVLESGVVPL